MLFVKNFYVYIVIIWIFILWIFIYYPIIYYPENIKASIFYSSKSQNNEARSFVLHSKKLGLFCGQLFKNDTTYLKKLKRIAYKDDDNLKTDCETVKARSFFAKEPNSKDEATFPIAYARIVFKDYLFLEMELAASYAPQNYYCFGIDKSSSDLFRIRMKNLSKCFPNVIIPLKEYDLDSSGSNHNEAFLECLKELFKFSWKYVVLLQNHDIILRTNAEMVQIFKWYNGTNDIAVRRPMWQRINKKFNWTFSGLNLFKEPSKNLIGFNGFEPKLNFAKGMVQSSLSREMVDFVLTKLNLTILLKQLAFKKNAAPEESLLQTLQATDALDMPGGFTHACLDRNKDIFYITRRSFWEGGKPSKNCLSKKVRNSLCIYGFEDIHKLDDMPFITFNKMMPEFDFSAILCWHERLFNRTYMESNSIQKLNSDFYLSLPHVRFHHEKLENGKVDLKNFKCS